MYKNWLQRFALITILLLVLTACGASGEQAASGSDANEGSEASGQSEYVFKLGHETPPTHIFHQTAEKFSEVLQEKTDGRLQVEIFPGSQLGSNADMLQQMETGAIDFGIIPTAFMGTRADEFNAWHMPFLFDDLEDATKAVDLEPVHTILQNLESQGFVGLGFAFAGNRHILMTTGAVTSPNDLQGKKLRIISNPVMLDFWQSMGVGPTPMPLSEVYTSLQTGVIDGIDIDLDALVTLNLYEIAQDLTLTNHMAFPAVVMMSKVTHDQLLDEDRQLVLEAMDEAISWGMEEAVKREEENLQYLQDQGLNITEMTDHSAFENVKEELYAKYSENPLIKQFIVAN